MTDNVRIATLDDLDEIMRLAVAGAEENSFVKPSHKRLLAEIYPAVVRDHGIVGCIGGQTLEGAVVLRLGTMWYSDDPVLEEKAVFVDPKFRAAKIGRARLLTDFSKQAADGLGVPLIIGILSNHRTEAKVRLYKRQFGEPAGAFWLYGGQTGGQHVDLAEAAD